MIDNDDLEDRHAIPRWLSLKQSCQLGELGARSVPSASNQLGLITLAQKSLTEEFDRLRVQWGISKELSDAEEFVAVAVVAGRVEDDQVQAAISSIKNSDLSSESAVAFAERAILRPDEISSSLPIEEAQIRLDIAKRKRFLGFNPRDTLRLTETALLYASIGQNKSSESLIKRALILSPVDRYILRAATRFFMHLGEQERAYHLLRKVASSDPWLRSALLAVEASLGYAPKGWRQAKSLLENSKYSPRDLSELAVQMGTLEFGEGSRKQGLRFIRQGAVSPTENAIAQIEWVGRKKKAFNVDDVSIDLSLSHEASAYAAFDRADWEASLTHCEAWRSLEPFSARAPIFGSFVASLSESLLERGIVLTKQGQLANPRNPTLCNNLAVLLASQGDVSAAKAELVKLNTSEILPDDKITITATRGLISFRSGEFEQGSKLYLEAIEEASKQKNAGLALRAFCFLSREVSIIDGATARSFIEKIDEAFGLLKSKGSTIPVDLLYLRKQIELLMVVSDQRLQARVPEINWGELLQQPFD